MTSAIVNINDLVRGLLMDQSLAFTRYGDGEFSSMFGEEGENCDGHFYFNDMRRDLIRTLQHAHPDKYGYHYGLVRIAEITHGQNKIYNWCANHGIAIRWENGTCIKDAAMQGKLFPLIQQLRQMNIVYVGPEYMNAVGLWELFRPKRFIKVREKNAYYEMQQTVDELATYLGNERDNVDLVGFSAGPMTEIVIHRLWPVFWNSVKFVDFGSIFDGFIGVRNRSYNKTKIWDEVMGVNLGQDT